MSATGPVALVTGAAGFLGRALVESLLADGFQVRGLDDGSGTQGSAADGWRPSLREGLDWRKGDVRNAADVTAAAYGADLVFHLAVRGARAGGPVDPVETHQVNAEGTLRVLEAARAARVSRLVNASSWQVRGLREGRGPASSLAVEKLTGEVYCELYHRLHALGTVSLRYFPIFGSEPSSADRAEAEEAGGFVSLEDAVRATRLAAAEGAAVGTVIDVGTGRLDGSGTHSDPSDRSRTAEATGMRRLEGER